MLMPTRTDVVPDRRRRPRLGLACAVRLRRPGDTLRIDTTPEDLSCEGFFCFSERVFSLHEALEVELSLAGQKPGVERETILPCAAEQARIHPGPGRAFGGASHIDDYPVEHPLAVRDLPTECVI